MLVITLNHGNEMLSLYFFARLCVLGYSNLYQNRPMGGANFRTTWRIIVQIRVKLKFVDHLVVIIFQDGGSQQITNVLRPCGTAMQPLLFKPARYTRGHPHPTSFVSKAILRTNNSDVALQSDNPIADCILLLAQSR
jgi:hypothetical protein